MILRGDCIEELKKLEDNSVDAIVTDPPYGLSFMGKKWDKFKKINSNRSRKDNELTAISRGPEKYVAGVKMQEFFTEFSKEALRVLKPGAFLLAFGGTRTYHRLACGIEDAGFEIRDCIQWLYGSGFPKSLNIGKQIDKMQGNEREYLGEKLTGGIKRVRPDNSGEAHPYAVGQRLVPYTKGTSEWEGWGTALKPANEPIVVARKPLSEKNVALNVLKWGTGGINIDACRIGTEVITQHGRKEKEGTGWNTHWHNDLEKGKQWQGRFPANIILDEEAGKMLDEQSGVSKSSIRKAGENKIFNTEKGWNNNNINFNTGGGHSDKGGASRFFYCAKASKKERNLGCEDMEEKENPITNQAWKCSICNKYQLQGNGDVCKCDNPKWIKPISKNNHPTVKPIKLMEYLIKLVSREEATILDPFMGSGTTGIACVNLNRKFIGIEKEEDYIKIAEARILKSQQICNQENKSTQAKLC